MPAFTGLLALSTTVGARAAPVASLAPSHGTVTDQPLFIWSGRVDREVLIVVRGRGVSTRGVDARLPNRSRVINAIPRADGDVFVRLEQGRGSVQVIEQPSARNGYSTVIRIVDPRGGADSYQFTAFHEPDRRFDRTRRNDRDDRYERDGRYDRADRYDRDRNSRGEWDNRSDRSNRSNRSNTRDGGVLQWRGWVDDVVELRMRGRRVDAFTRSGERVQQVSSNIRGALPNRDVIVNVEQRSGRGSIIVIQQPSSRNSYTAVIRISDQRAGAADYGFSAFW